MLLDDHADASPRAAERVAAECKSEHIANLEAAAVVLGYALDAEDARLLLDAVMPVTGDELRALLRELRGGESWDLARVRKMVLDLAADGRPFSANRFYAGLPREAWPLIGPALQSLRHRHFETVGTEIAVNPARKMSRVTLYRLRPEIRPGTQGNAVPVT